MSDNSFLIALAVAALAVIMAIAGIVLPESSSFPETYPYGNLTDIPQTFPYGNLTGYPNTFPYGNLTEVPQTFPYANLTGVPDLNMSSYLLNSLVLWLPFDGGIADSYCAQYGSSYVSNGKFNSALYFNGSAVANFTGLDSFTQLSSFSVSAWVKVNATGTTRSIIARNIIGDSAIVNFRLIGSGVADFYLYDGSHLPRIIGTVNVSDNDWHMITGVRNCTSGYLYLYVDGVGDGSVVDTVVGYSNNALLEIGVRKVNESFMIGCIDDVRIYNRVLSVSEILALYNGAI